MGKKYHILTCVKAGLVHYNIIILPKWFGKYGLCSTTQYCQPEMQRKLSRTHSNCHQEIRVAMETRMWSMLWAKPLPCCLGGSIRQADTQLNPGYMVLFHWISFCHLKKEDKNNNEGIVEITDNMWMKEFKLLIFGIDNWFILVHWG